MMPQKRNPDGLELVRAKSAGISADVLGIKTIIRSLPSGYNRDFQETKGPFFRGCEAGLGCARIMDLTIDKLIVNEDHLRAAFTPEIYATDRALELVSDGVPFRDAYQQIGRSLQDLGARDPAEAISKKRSTGSPGNLRLDIPRAQAVALREWREREEKLKTAKIGRLAGMPVELFRDPLK
jgi:argininosuccinate lyase